jgi:hypothetical protein
MHQHNVGAYVCVIGDTQGVSEMLGQTSGVISLHENKETCSYQYMSAQQYALTSVTQIFICGDT